MANSTTTSHQDLVGQTGSIPAQKMIWPPFRPYPFPGPWDPWPGSGPYDPGPDYLLALSIGQLHGRELRTALGKFEEVGKDRRRYLRNGLERLAGVSQISSADLEQLYLVLDLVIEFDKKSSNPEEINSRIRDIYDKLIDQNASPVAIALTGVAVDSTSRMKMGPIAEADFAGATAGGVIGSLFPGVGTLIGVLAGAAIASIEVAIDNK